MRLAKIKNKYMFKTLPNDSGVHYYLIYFDRKNKRYNAIQLTHLYIKDKNRFIQVNKGLIKIEKLKEFEVPSGVKKEIYTTNIFGEKIDISNKKYVEKVFSRHLNKKQAERIKNFVK